MNDADLHWLAGYLEGEGCFSFSQGRGRDGKRLPGIAGTPSVSVTSTDLDVLTRAADLMKSKSIGSRPTSGRRKQTFNTRVTGNRAIDLMKTLLPLMASRRSGKIREVLALCAARVGKPSGERCWKSKLSASQVAEIRALYALGEPQSSLAKRFGVGQSNISSIVNLRSRRTA